MSYVKFRLSGSQSSLSLRISFLGPHCKLLTLLYYYFFFFSNIIQNNLFSRTMISPNQGRSLKNNSDFQLWTYRIMGTTNVIKTVLWSGVFETKKKKNIWPGSKRFAYQIAVKIRCEKNNLYYLKRVSKTVIKCTGCMDFVLK